MEELMKITETDIMEHIHNNLNKIRYELSDLKVEATTFDLDEQLDDFPLISNLTNNGVKKKTVSQIKKEEVDVNTFKSTLSYYDKKKKEDFLAKRGVEIKEIDIIESLDEIDKLDEGKTWKQLDNWMKQKKLKEYAAKYIRENKSDLGKGNGKGNEIEIETVIKDYEKNLIELFHKGEFRKTAQVTYEVEQGYIIQLHSKLLSAVK